MSGYNWQLNEFYTQKCFEYDKNLTVRNQNNHPPPKKKNFDNVSGMLKNDFAYEVNGFCTRFANYFFAISLQDRQIVISSQFKKLERLVSHTNIFKTCSIGDGENVLKIHSKEKKFIIKKNYADFSLLFERRPMIWMMIYLYIAKVWFLPQPQNHEKLFVKNL